VDLETGWVFLYDPELRKHHLASWKNVPEALKTHLLKPDSEDLCDCQQKLQAGLLGDDVLILSCQRLQGCNCDEKPYTHITIPIKAREIWFGMINLYYPSTEPLALDTFDLLSSIGTQISESVANAWFQIKLNEKEAARQLLLESLVNAQEDERSRLARELHDQAGQTLTNLLIRLKTIESKSSEEPIKESLQNALGIVSQSIEQIRDLSYRLRPPALEEFGLGTAIAALVEDMTHEMKIETNYKCNLDSKLPPEIEVVLYRIVQEGLTNIIRHAEARLVTIELACQHQNFYMKIEDDGIGFDPGQIPLVDGQQHLGLISMSERTELIGGRFNMYSAPEKGTTIEVFVPISQMEESDE
jgi:signal transduction histidine kinase